MINNRQILILIIFLVTRINFGLSQELNKVNKDWRKIESIFQKIEPNSELKSHCEFEYKKGSEPDVDMWDISYKLLLSDIDRPKVVKLVDYYVRCCNECDSNSTIRKFQVERDSFLTDDFYSIELNYKIVKKKTLGILALIYFKKGYILFSIDFK